MCDPQSAFEKQIREYVSRIYGTAEYRDCPLCGQGALVPAEIAATAERIIFCDECDSIWSDNDPIDDTHAKAFQTFVNKRGEVGLDWTKLELKIA